MKLVMANDPAGGLSKLANAILLTMFLVLPAGAASPWRFWEKADGLMESWVFGLTLDSQGRVVVKHGEVPSESVLDGYQVTGIPSQHAYGKLLSSPEKQLWTFDAEGILVHDAFGWHKYPVSEIAEFAKVSDMPRAAWYLYAISSYRTVEQDERMDVVPLGNDFV